MATYPPISSYAVIGDTRSAALISRDGSVDWLCLPRLDSPAIFAALLDTQHGGRIRVRPTGEYRSERRYLPDSNVLETTFHTPSGVCILRDLMPVTSEEEKRAELLPEHEVLREVECITDEVEIDVLYEPRPDYGRARPRIEQRGPTPTRQLEPPGFLALNYGHRTPISVILSHLVYGGILGAFYRPR